jgi:hypothetical protein
MTQCQVQWLLDCGLPRGDYHDIDVVHAEDFDRVPGPAGIREARELGRALVTCDEEFRGPCSLTIDHPGIVIIEARPVDGPEVVRNLMHVEFRLGQYGDSLQLAGNRFLVRTDLELCRILPDGTEIDLEPWKQVRMDRVPAFAI